MEATIEALERPARRSCGRRVADRPIVAVDLVRHLTEWRGACSAKDLDGGGARAAGGGRAGVRACRAHRAGGGWVRRLGVPAFGEAPDARRAPARPRWRSRTQLALHGPGARGRGVLRLRLALQPAHPAPVLRVGGHRRRRRRHRGLCRQGAGGHRRVEVDLVGHSEGAFLSLYVPKTTGIADRVAPSWPWRRRRMA